MVLAAPIPDNIAVPVDNIRPRYIVQTTATTQQVFYPHVHSPHQKDPNKILRITLGASDRLYESTC
jgi:hypothetical protein